MARGLNQAARIVSEGINGYLRGTGIQRGMDREKKEDEWRDEQRANMRTDRQRAEDERAGMIEASSALDLPPMPKAPVGGGPVQPAPGSEREPGAPLVPGKVRSSEEIAGRQADYLRSIGKPMEAAQLESANVQAKAAKFTLDKAKEEFVNEQANQKALTITTPEQLSSFLSGSPLVGGKEVSIVKTADGKKFQMMVPGPDGNMVKFGDEIGTATKDIQRMVAERLTKLPTAQKITVLQQFQAMDERQREFDANEKFRRDQLGQTDRHYRAIEGNAAAGLKLQQDRHNREVQNDPWRNVPAIVKQQDANYGKVIDAINDKIIAAKAQNQWDPKSQGAIELDAQLRHYQGERNKLLKPYLDKLPGGAPSVPPYPGGGKAAPGAGDPKTAAGRAMRAVENDPKFAGSVQIQPGGGVTQVGAAAGGLGDGVIGPLTPIEDIQAAAAAGDQRAIEYLRRREEAALQNETAPRSAASQINRY